MKTRVFISWPLSVSIASAIAFASIAFGQTNADPELLPKGGLYNLTPVGKVLQIVLWSFGAIVIAIVAGVAVLRHRVNPSLYNTVADEHWQEDAHEELGETFDEGEAIEAGEHVMAPAPGPEGTQAKTEESEGGPHARLYTPASGPAWNESMLNAFLSSCLKANCLGRVWQEEAVRRQQALPVSLRQPDPREAEFVRRMKARWPQFHVDPESGIFIDHLVDGAERNRVCLIEVVREKRAITEAALNAGFVIESLGRYLKSSDMVYRNDSGYYHALSRQQVTELPEEKKKLLLRLKDIPHPWETMIAGLSFRTSRYCSRR